MRDSGLSHIAFSLGVGFWVVFALSGGCDDSDEPDHLPTGAATATATSGSGAAGGVGGGQGGAGGGPLGGAGGAGGGAGGDGGQAGSAGSGGEAGEPPCDAAGLNIVPTGAGTCAEPLEVDLSDQPFGTTVRHVASGGSDEVLAEPDATCGRTPQLAARDTVYRVLVPQGTAQLRVEATSPTTADPLVAILGAATCSAPANVCADAVAAGACEVASAVSGASGFGTETTFVVVSALVATLEPIHVSFSASR